MSTSAILPISSIDFGNSTATAPQQTVFSNLLNQLQQAIGSGDSTTTATLLNAIEALSPSAATGSNALGTFLTSVGSALKDGSISEAQSALATYQSNSTPAAATPPASKADTSATAAAIAANLVQSQLQLSLVTTLLGPDSSLGSNAPSSSSNSPASLIDILNAAYGTSSNSSSTSTSASPSASSATPATASSPTPPTPYDKLVSSIQASLAAGNGTITPALAYLQASGNFVNTSA